MCQITTTTTYYARLRFQKTGLMRWVGHLDLMRFFQKAIRRAGLPIAYSGGFHPHQKLSFALPLGIGITSEGEYLDVELTEEMPPDEAIRRLNEQMSDGMQILAFRYLPTKTKKAMSFVAAARYLLHLKGDADGVDVSAVDWSAEIRRFYHDAPEIRITKKTKKGEREVDLKPLIYEFSVCDDASKVGFYLTLSAGSVENIKPELVFSHFMASLGFSEDNYSLAIHRINLFARNGDGALVGLERF